MEGDHNCGNTSRGYFISIHSLRMEGDHIYLLLTFTTFYFNPLPPYGGRPAIRNFPLMIFHFNPLPPYGGRHFNSAPCAPPHAFQSTPSVWRETSEALQNRLRELISIHSLRMEGDQKPDLMRFAGRHFNPLPPYGGRRFFARFLVTHSSISIHSLRMEGDGIRHFRKRRSEHFNPLPPYGGRHNI